MLRATSLILLLTGATLICQAQKKGVIKGFKPPKITTTLGGFKDSSVITVDQASGIIALPLRFTDNAKGVYTISSYQFMYRKKNVVEDEETGKKRITTTGISKLFKTSPLPADWVNAVKEQLEPTGEIIFADVIVKDEQGRVMYATDLKISIK